MTGGEGGSARFGKPLKLFLNWKAGFGLPTPTLYELDSKTAQIILDLDKQLKDWEKAPP